MVTREPNQQQVEIVLLSVLSEEPMYGYAISKRVATGSDGAIKLSPGVLYPLLRQMEKEGYITANWETVKSDRAEEGTEGRKRKWYTLSAKGRTHLEQRVAAHRAHQRMIERFLGGSGAGAGGEEAAS